MGGGYAGRHTTTFYHRGRFSRSLWQEIAVDLAAASAVWVPVVSLAVWIRHPRYQRLLGFQLPPLYPPPGVAPVRMGAGPLSRRCGLVRWCRAGCLPCRITVRLGTLPGIGTWGFGPLRRLARPSRYFLLFPVVPLIQLHSRGGQQRALWLTLLLRPGFRPGKLLYRTYRPDCIRSRRLCPSRE